MPVVALSLETGCRDANFVAAMAGALGLKLVDLRALEQKLAERTDVGGGHLLQPPGKLSRSIAKWHLSRGDLANLLRDEILEAARYGDVLIASACAAPVLRPTRHVACVHIRGSLDFRTNHIQRQLAYPCVATAVLEVESEGALMTRFVRRLFDRDWRDPALYDLTIDAEHVDGRSSRQLIEMITQCPAYRDGVQTRAAIAAYVDQLADLPLEGVAIQAASTGVPRHHRAPE